jgi:trimeric autotransporter adhesin
MGSPHKENIQMATRMQQRRGTAAQWTAANPVLAAGEIGFETDSGKFKMGDGVNTWSSLFYFADSADFDTTAINASINSAVSTAVTDLVAGAPAALNTLNEIAAAIDNNASYAATIVQSLSEKASTSAMTAADLVVANAADAALTAHSNETTNIHGIANTALLATTSYVDTAEADAITAAGAAASTAIDAHNADTQGVHGIANTENLATKGYAETQVSDHNADTTSVHGIADTALLATTANVATAKSEAISSAETKVSDHNSDTTNVHGISDTAALATKTYADSAVSTAVAALTKSSVGLANVDNTSDASKPVSTATQTELDLKAPKADPTFTGTVSGVTKAHVGLGNVDNTADSAKPVSTAQATAIATAKSEAIADATAQVNAVIASAPAALNTLDELAAALGDDANFASTVTTSLSAKAPSNAPTFTGLVTVAAAGVAFTDGTQTKVGVPSITTFATAISSSATLAAGEQDKFVPLTGAVTITLPATGYSTGQSIDFYQASGTGAVFAATNSVVGTPGLKFRTTNSVVTAMKTAAGWLVFGDLSA